MINCLARLTSLITLSAFLGISAQCQTFSTPATEAVTIGANGAITGAKGDKFFNVEGKAKEKFSCYGVLKFDGAKLKKELDAKLGANKYILNIATLELTQSNAKFTSNGSVNVYLTSMTKEDLAKLKYPYSPTSSSNKGELIGTCNFIQKERADTKETVSKAITPTFKVDAIEFTNKGLLAAIAKGESITIVLAEGGPNVAATWAGKLPNGSAKLPTLKVKAIKR